MLKPPFWGGNMKTLGQASPAAGRCLQGSEGMEAQLAGGAGNGHQGGSIHSWDHSGGCTPTPVAYSTSQWWWWHPSSARE